MVLMIIEETKIDMFQIQTMNNNIIAEINNNDRDIHQQVLI